jgi:hypothetical protein
VQPLDGGQAGELGPAVVSAGGEQRGVAHEALDLDGIDTGVEQIRGQWLTTWGASEAEGKPRKDHWTRLW